MFVVHHTTQALSLLQHLHTLVDLREWQLVCYVVVKVDDLHKREYISM